MTLSAELATMSAKNNIILSSKQVEDLNCYYEMLKARDYIRDADITIRTIIDCLSCYDPLVFPIGGKVIDIASGAGFPGIPLKILRPDIKLCMLDASDSRLSFRQEVIDQLKLSEVTTIHCRVEDAATMPEHQGQYQVALSRGLSFHLSKLVESCFPLVKPGGYYIAFEFERTKGEVPEAAATIAAMGGELTKTVAREIEKRVFVYVKKVR
ncbi:Ribosomal RNA small subunit methyltransferase G [Sporomusa ovata DSM 2662]|uniref:Ribosomal RNA small subunit methyltransferase G n=1 Tax=Sporomusa ovata TaxID=2378 RepID=A0A0U1KWX5_9FIRM|nr:16S rRNA (guanine(527)-N(7))-methyltransferase RsmG [Sporomusa ovata]EQB28217.1 ribosomal RNA small subunit methyltransferase G [Sporomusa ovata DSM 2662]CQR71755.1 rRNA small subunit 7-methylguanosine (m7G) methyltransferase GidB [Sporomusa ovata]